MKKTVLLLGVALATLGLFSGTAASAAPARQTSAASTASCPSTWFGYTGTIICGSDMPVDWNENGTTDEVFAIAPNRTIWHVWPTSGGWKLMPNNGRADDTYGWGTGPDGHYVYVRVDIGGFSYLYYSLYSYSTRTWLGWYRA